MKKELKKRENWDWGKKAEEWAEKVGMEQFENGTVYVYPDGVKLYYYHASWEVTIHPGTQMLWEYYIKFNDGDAINDPSSVPTSPPKFPIIIFPLPFPYPLPEIVWPWIGIPVPA